MSAKKPRAIKIKKRISVDAAMAAERPAKQAVRELWFQQHQQFDQAFPDDDPLLLTLSGEGREIRILIQRGVIKLTETGAIAPESQNRVIAIERNPAAVLSLQRQFPGLKIIQQDFKALIGGNTLRRFPQREQEPLFCAKVINLDLQETLHEIESGGGVDFPVLTWIRKLGQIHADLKPRLEWCLCLTLNGTLTHVDRDGTITWSETISRVIQGFLRENFQHSQQFTHSCQSLLGGDLFNKIAGTELLDLSSLTQEEHQKLLMIFVPKKIAQLLYDQNWQVRTMWNLRYGGQGDQAPMVTWIISFIWDPRSSVTPNAVYLDSLHNILVSAGYINEDGQIEAFS